MMTNKKMVAYAVSMSLLLLLGSCNPPAKNNNSAKNETTEVATQTNETFDAALVKQGEELFKAKTCVACHSVDGSQRIGPSLKGLFGRTVKVVSKGQEKQIAADEEYFARSIKEPNADVVAGFNEGTMVLSSTPTDDEIKAIMTYIKSVSQKASPGEGEHIKIKKTMAAPNITPAEMKTASEIYFNRCAGCHGMLRNGATGPNLLPKRTKELGSEGISTVVTYGLPGGMPPWGEAGILSKDEVALLAKFLQHEPPSPPEMSMADMQKTWKEIVPPAQRVKKPAHNKNWKNFFGVVLRDAGKVAIIDGDTKETVNVIDTGFAVHILRTSASGRYIYSIGRDGKVTMIDLWMEKPDVVAEVKACFDARSVDGSKYHGPKGDFRDKYLIVGGYWPPSIIIFDGQTLKPLKIFSTSGYTYDTNEFLREARAAAIVSSHQDPEWVVNIKETGQMWLVNYEDIDNLKITAIEAERFLHDGGWDSSGRYVLMAANARNRIAVVDTKEKKLVKLVDVGKKPHPGRGANIKHPTFGPIWCTGHLGDNTIACIGTDPQGHPQHAWKVVKSFNLSGGGGGNLFVKTHPNSKHLWADRTLNPDDKLSRSVDIIDTTKLEVIKTVSVPEKFPGKAVHLEYNEKGDEVWVSSWAGKDKQSALLIYDDKTMELKKEITGDWLVTPTGKFNVANTMGDIY